MNSRACGAGPLGEQGELGVNLTQRRSRVGLKQLEHENRRPELLVATYLQHVGQLAPRIPMHARMHARMSLMYVHACMSVA